MTKVIYNPKDADYRLEGVTVGNVYDVIEYMPDDTRSDFDKITILDDSGFKRNYYISDILNMIVFDDISVEFRNDIIDNILQ